MYELVSLLNTVDADEVVKTPENPVSEVGENFPDDNGFCSAEDSEDNEGSLLELGLSFIVTV